jgi:indolepyruvate ferredoxin oxidoreductase, beta subunit
MDAVRSNYELGVEILQCRRLIKGYSDTHARGLSKFDQVISAIKLIEKRADAADWARRLRDAALKEGAGRELEGAIQTIKTFA